MRGKSGQYEHKQKSHDSVNSPLHYASGDIECIDAIEEATKGLEGLEAVCTANAIKYLWRWKKKGGINDLDKCVWYVNKLREVAKEKA